MSNSALIAIGGNSLIRAGERGTIAEQAANARQISEAVSGVLAQGVDLVITHGNGPQVGAALLRSERAAGQVYEQPLDVCVATTQGEIGYLLQQALELALRERALSRTVVSMITRTVVDPNDPAFGRPTKPIGPFYSHSAAEEKRRQLGWHMVEDSYRGYRRVVPSPRPVEIIEEGAIRKVLAQHILVIAAGGGGIPVIHQNGGFRGVEAVIDKDRASSLLARRLPVEQLVFSTDADYVYVDYKSARQRPLKRVKTAELRSYYNEGQFPVGSMGPKIEAALEFLAAGGREVIITSHGNLEAAVNGEEGTHILPD